MNLSFVNGGWADYQWWILNSDKKSLNRLAKLIDDILRNGYSGIGKPEPLKGDRSGWWSRRIDEKHRIVYRIVKDTVEIAQCKSHYDD